MKFFIESSLFLCRSLGLEPVLEFNEDVTIFEGYDASLLDLLFEKPTCLAFFRNDGGAGIFESDPIPSDGKLISRLQVPFER